MHTLFSILDYADYNTRVISDLIGCPSVLYHRRYVNKLLDKIKSLPERCFGQWYSGIELHTLFKHELRDRTASPVLLVYECNHLATNIKLLVGMKRYCPRLKLVLILTNIVGVEGGPKPNFAKLRAVFDLIVTFSEDDAREFDLTYYEGMYSHIRLDGLRKEEEDCEYDVYFCGKDKGRVAVLLSVANALDRQSVSYRFDIIGSAGPNKRGFYYQRDLIPNSEMLRRASRAKTVLEVMADPDNRGSSLRPYEAYALKTKLLSNNRFLVDKPWFNPKQISIFEDADRIDVDFVRTPLESKDAQDIGVLSPNRFLEFLAAKLGLEFKAG